MQDEAFRTALERCGQLDKTAVTPAFLQAADGKIAWVFDNYLPD